MWIAKLIGTDIEVMSEDMLEAYCALSEFAPDDARISVKYVPNANW